MNWTRLLLSLICLITLLTPAAALAAQPTARELVIAYQPLASPGCVLMELLSRDQLLRRALARSGLTLRLHPVSNGSEAITALRKGEVTLTTLGDMPALELAATTPVMIFAQLKQNYAMVVGRKGLTARELKGKRIGNVHASSGHFALLKVLQSAGLGEKDVTLVALPVSQMPDALQKGTIDAFAAWEPTPSLAIANAPDRLAAIGRQNTSAYLVANRTMLERHPEVGHQVAAALVRAMGWLKEANHLQQAVALNLATIGELNNGSPQNRPEQLQRIVAADLAAIRYSPRLAPLTPPRDTASLAAEFGFLKTLGKIPPLVDWEEIQRSLNRTIVDQVIRNPGHYQTTRYAYD